MKEDALPHLNLDHQRKRARALLKRVRAHDPDALRRLHAHARVATATASLTDAQLVVARESGFASWTKLKAHVRAECLTRPLMLAALVAAANRACETELDRPLYRDTYARRLAGEAGLSPLSEWLRASWPGYGSGPNPYLSVLTKFFDDALQRAVHNSDIRQLVIVSAGMDTRAFRLPWPCDLIVFEVDRPEVFEHKEPVLDQLDARAACHRHIVSADPNGSWAHALVKRGFDPKRPSAFLQERLEYFDSASANRLLREITTVAAAGSWLGFAAHTEETRRSELLRPFLNKLQALGLPPWQFGLNEPEAWLAPHGWEAASVIAGTPEANYGRWPLCGASRDRVGIPRALFTQAWLKEDMCHEFR